VLKRAAELMAGAMRGASALLPLDRAVDRSLNIIASVRPIVRVVSYKIRKDSKKSAS
jgi:hypothetical protein